MIDTHIILATRRVPRPSGGAIVVGACGCRDWSAILRVVSSRIERIEFAGSQGASLAARLDLPAGPPLGFVLFAHCFTCSKDLQAATCIATQLTRSGFGVLRFDFTGLGASDGEFANTNFSSNVDDLRRRRSVAARTSRAPEPLIGHSLGGAAVLAAAAQVPEVKAIATIGAPAAASHVTGALAGAVDEIERTGEATVELAGRTFTVRQQFIDDVCSQKVLEQLGSFPGALLIMHSPIDNTVGVEHAVRIFEAAHHPKSFVALDGADHLLTDARDAEFAARVIGTWASRYVDDASGSPRRRPRPHRSRCRDDAGGVPEPRRRRPAPVPRRRARVVGGSTPDHRPTSCLPLRSGRARR